MICSPTDLLVFGLALILGQGVFDTLSLWCALQVMRVSLIGLHESGHAIAALLLKLPVQRVYVGWQEGYLQYGPCTVYSGDILQVTAAGPATTFALGLTMMVCGGEFDTRLATALPILGLFMASPIGGSARDLESAYYLMIVGGDPNLTSTSKPKD